MMRLFTIGFLFFITQAFAENQYLVNVLIFSRITPAALSSEAWQSATAPTDTNSNIENASAKSALFSNDKKILEKNGNYRVLFSGQWKLSWPNTKTTFTLPITGGTQWGDQSELSGQIRIGLDRYFDVQSALTLTEPTDQLRSIAAHDNVFQNWNQSYFSFAFTQARRMRSRELNYLDHPLMGVLIEIIPAKENHA